MTTRVGDGTFPIELLNATGEILQKRSAEFGVTNYLALLKFTSIV